MSLNFFLQKFGYLEMTSLRLKSSAVFEGVKKQFFSLASKH